MLEYLGGYDSEKSYRSDHSSMNYSKLADFDKLSPLGWKKKYIDGDVSDQDDDELRQGSLLDLRLLGTDEDFEDNVHLSIVEKKPTPNNLKFCQNLFKLVQNNKDVGVGDLMQEAYDLSGIKSPKFPKFVEDFVGSDTELYFQDMIDSQGKIVSSIEEMEQVTRTCDVLVGHPNSRWVFNTEGTNQLKIKFGLWGQCYRVMLDRVVVDHKNRKIYPIDLKTAYNPLQFQWNYIKYRYYIQQGLYSKGVKAWAKDVYPGYSVQPFQFLVIDFLGLYAPNLWSFEFDDGDEWMGFAHNGRKYKGINRLMADLEWHREFETWNNRREAYENKGKIKIIL